MAFKTIERHQEWHREYMRAYRAKNKEKTRAEWRKYYHKNKGKIASYQRCRYKQNREKWRAYNRAWWAEKRRDPIARMILNLRSRVPQAIKRNQKAGRVLVMLGCSIPDFKIYLESKFEPGMTWENYGKAWEIDHIMPCVIFDFSKPEHQKRCFHFSNLQPLWAAANKSKRCAITTEQFNLL